MQASKHRTFGVLSLVGYAIGRIAADIINPLWYREIFDVITVNSVDPVAAWPIISRLFFVIVATVIIYNIAYRLGDVAIARFQSDTLKDLMN